MKSSIKKWGKRALYVFGALMLVLLGMMIAPSGEAIETGQIPAAALPTYTPYPTLEPLPTLVREPTPYATWTPWPKTGPDLEILSMKNHIDNGWFCVVGEVRNNSAYAMKFVKIVITLYNDAGNVTGTDFTYADLDLIPAGGTSPFSSGTDSWKGTTKYKCQVQGRRAD